MAGDRRRAARAHPGADRLGQDARRVPLGLDRARPGEGTPGPLRLAAEGAHLRHRAEPARAARRAIGSTLSRRRPHRRHAGARARARCCRARRHPHHHARVALLDAHVPPREILRTVERRHRRRGPRDGRDEARRAPGLSPRTARAARRTTVPAHRPLRHPAPAGGDRPLCLGGRPIEAASTPATREELDLRVVVPLEDMREPGEGRRRRSGRDLPGGSWSWCATHRSTMIFVNNRRLAERLAPRLNELAGRRSRAPTTARCPASSASSVEERLKGGDIPRLVATSSLELGIDMGAVDLVVQVESPKSVARGLQRVGRAGHHLVGRPRGASSPSSAAISSSAPSSRADARGADRGDRIPRNPLDVLAQQIVAVCAVEEIAVDELHDLVRRAWPFRDLSREQLETCSTCSPAATRPRSSPSCARASPGTASAGLLPGARARVARRDQRGAHPGPRPLRRVPRRGRRARRRARRGDGLRGARRRDVPPRRLDLADRGDHARPRARLARARHPGPGAVLARRWRRPPLRSGEAIGRAGRELAGSTTSARRERCPTEHDLDERAARTCSATSPSRSSRPAPLPTRPHDRRRTLPRRARRLAPLHPHPIRRPRTRALGAGRTPAPARRRAGSRPLHLVGRRRRASPARR